MAIAKLDIPFGLKRFLSARARLIPDRQTLLVFDVEIRRCSSETSPRASNTNLIGR